MRADEREALRRRYQFRCAYCGVTENDVGAELTVDHFQRRSKGGSDEPDNWVYCCHACNEYKGDYWQPDLPRRILHPLRDNLAAHLVEQEDATLEDLTETGTFHIERLRLNRRPLIAFRRVRRRIEAERQTQAALLQRLRQLEERIQTLTAQLEQLDRGDTAT